MKNALRITCQLYLLDLNKRCQKVTTLTFTDFHRQNILLAIMTDSIGSCSSCLAEMFHDRMYSNSSTTRQQSLKIDDLTDVRYLIY